MKPETKTRIWLKRAPNWEIAEIRTDENPPTCRAYDLYILELDYMGYRFGGLKYRGPLTLCLDKEANLELHYWCGKAWVDPELETEYEMELIDEDLAALTRWYNQ